MYTMLATRSFEAKVNLPSVDKEFKVKVNKGQNIKDFCHHLLETHALPAHVFSSIYSTMTLASSCQTTPEPSKRDRKESRHLFLDAYQSNTLFYNNKPEEDIFPRAYHTLVHCPIAAIFDTLLELEQSYAFAMQELIGKFEQELLVMKDRHGLEIEGSSNNPTTLFTRQVEETEMFQATWQSDILQVQQTQRQEYREFVIELYREYQSRLSHLSDEKQQDVLTKLDGKEIVAVAAGRVKQSDTHQANDGSIKSHESSSKARLSHNSSSHDLVRTSSSPESIESTLQSPQSIELVKMGFAKERVEAALVLGNQNMEAAIGLLVDNSNKIDAYMQEQKIRPSTSTPYRRSYSLSQVSRPDMTPSPPLSVRQTDRRHSLQRLSTTPTSFLTAKNNNNNNAPTKSWNPISFLHQQKQNMENTNLSSMKKLSGWIGKAMENFGIENDESGGTRLMQQSSPQLVESFTISMGTTQIKSSHNLRLLVTDEATEVFHPVYDPPREMAYRAETSTKLYTSHLSAMIVLVELNELEKKGWRQYKLGKSSNKALFDRCQQSTEFHFSDIEAQLSLIENDFDRLVEGSFFVTKHSNLPSQQVIFHLLIDSSAMTTHDLSNRHPVILGLRNILKMTTQYDISSLSIPLLLLPDRFTEQKEFNWLQKRGEVVMKCIKGYLIENSRSGKRVQNEGLDRGESMGGGGMRNIEFLLPKKPELYTPIPTTEPITGVVAPEVEIAFQQFRSLLTVLFRTS
ncbi:hypothetical protein BD770DRAFT_360710 [Pilaira anomala]|nr:hypothetical protein BD770DRAFT_360710 [Pilaira anomala]